MSSPGITKRFMAQAMKALMAEKPLAKISVGDIVDYCDLNRNSFYYHFKDKYDLVNWIFSTELMAEMGTKDMDRRPAWELVEELCCFLYKDRQFYVNALSVEGQNSFSEFFTEMIKTLITARVEFDEDEDDAEFFVCFFADAFIMAIFRWLRSGAKTPPEQLAAKIKRAATGAAARIIESQD